MKRRYYLQYNQANNGETNNEIIDWVKNEVIKNILKFSNKFSTTNLNIFRVYKIHSRLGRDINCIFSIDIESQNWEDGDENFEDYLNQECSCFATLEDKNEIDYDNI